MTMADSYVLAVLPDYFYTTVNGQYSLVLAIAYSPAVPGRTLPEIPPFLAHDVSQPPTILFTNGNQSIAGSATHLPCWLDGSSTQMIFQFITSSLSCTDRNEIQTLVLIFPVSKELRTLALLLDGGKYQLILP